MPNVTQARPAPLNRAGAGRFTRQERLAYTMLVPILGSIFLIVTYPFVLAVIQSLQATNGGAFVGLQNYVTGLENPLLYEALGATAVYAALVLPTEILLGLGLALTAESRARRCERSSLGWRSSRWSFRRSRSGSSHA